MVFILIPDVGPVSRGWGYKVRKMARSYPPHAVASILVRAVRRTVRRVDDKTSFAYLSSAFIETEIPHSCEPVYQQSSYGYSSTLVIFLYVNLEINLLPQFTYSSVSNGRCRFNDCIRCAGTWEPSFHVIQYGHSLCLFFSWFRNVLVTNRQRFVI